MRLGSIWVCLAGAIRLGATAQLSGRQRLRTVEPLDQTSAPLYSRGRIEKWAMESLLLHGDWLEQFINSPHARKSCIGEPHHNSFCWTNDPWCIRFNMAFMGSDPVNAKHREQDASSIFCQYERICRHKVEAITISLQRAGSAFKEDCWSLAI